MAISEIGATSKIVQQPQETMLVQQDVFIRVFFSILANNTSAEIDSNSVFKIAEWLVPNDIYGANTHSFDTDYNTHTTLVFDCSDILLDESGDCCDTSGQFEIVLKAIKEIKNYVYGFADRMPKAKVHLYVIGFKMVDGIVRSFSYLVNPQTSLGIENIDEDLQSIITLLSPLSEYYRPMGYEFTVDFIREYEYYQVFQPLPNNSIVNEVPAQPMQVSNGTISMPLSHDSPESQDSHYLKGQVTKTEESGLDSTQTFLDVLSIAPVVGEVSSLTNGIIYLGREFNAGREGRWDDMKQYKKEAIWSFVGAIPGSSLVKGATKVIKTAKAAKAVTKTEKAAVAAKKALDSTSKAIDRALRSGKKSKNIELINLRRLSPIQAGEKVLIDYNNKKAKEALNSRLIESGIKLRDLLDTSSTVLRRPNYYRLIMDTSDKIQWSKSPKLPHTTEDRIIDMIDWTYKLFDFKKKMSDENN